MAKKKEIVYENVLLAKFVHGGQCIGTVQGVSLYSGKKIFVWGGLPGELVNVRITKKKKSYLEGTVTSVVEPSDERIEPKEPLSYLSTSPWQTMGFDAENKHKQEILQETFEREGVEGLKWAKFVHGDQQYGYRNKIEIGFWGDDDGVHLAHYVRGTRGKQIVDGNCLVNDSINEAARLVRSELNRLEIWAGDLKTLVLRSSAENRVVGALFVKKRLKLDQFELPEKLAGLVVYYSDPKSPASVPTEELYSLGDIKLMDTVGGRNITYDVMSFFQVNLSVFEQALSSISTSVETFSTYVEKVSRGNDAKDEKPRKVQVVDMYSGVGTIGLAIGADLLVESDSACVDMAKLNAAETDVEVIHATSESSLDSIKEGTVLIVDPPRAGLHKDVVERILETKPPLVVYLSCNPSTQARDVELLTSEYKIKYARGYNFFPRTPHIESLVILRKK